MSTVRVAPSTPIPFKINTDVINIPTDWTDVFDTGDFTVNREWDAGSTFNYTDDTPQTHTLGIPLITTGNNTIAIAISRSNTNSDFTVEFLDSSDTVLLTRTGIFSVSSTSSSGTFTDNDGDFIYWTKIGTDNDAVAKVRFTPETSTSINLTFSFKAPNKGLNIANFFTLASDTIASTTISVSKQYRILLDNDLFTDDAIFGVTIRFRDTANNTNEEFYLSVFDINNSSLCPLENGYRVWYFNDVSSNTKTGLTAQTAVTKVDIRLNYNISPNSPNNSTFPKTAGVKLQELVDFNKALIPIMTGQNVENNTLYAEESNRGFMTQAYEMPIPCNGVSTVQVYWTDTTYAPELAIVDRLTETVLGTIGMEVLDTNYYGAEINWADYDCSGCYEICIRKSIDNLLTDFDEGTFEDATVSNWNAESLGFTTVQDTTEFNQGTASGFVCGIFDNEFILKGSTPITSSPFKDYELDGYVNYNISPELDGSTNYYSSSVSNFRSGDSSGSMSIWFYVTQMPISTADVFWSILNADNTRTMNISITSSGAFQFQLVGTSSNRFTCTTTTILPETLYNAVIKSDGATYTVKINDVAQTLSFAVGANNGDWMDAVGATTRMHIGTGYELGSGYTKGYVPQFLYTTTVLSNAQITETYNSGNILPAEKLSYYASVITAPQFPTENTITDPKGFLTFTAVGTMVKPDHRIYLKPDAGSAVNNVLLDSNNYSEGVFGKYQTNLNIGSTTSTKIGLYAEGTGFVFAYVDDLQLRGPYICECTSEPLNLTTETDFLEVEYWNDSNGQLQSYANGWKNRMYIPGIIDYISSETESTKYTRSSGSVRLITARIKQLWKLITDRIPRYFHERITVMLAHENIKINGTRYVAEDGWEVEQKERKKLRNGSTTLARADYNQQTNNC